MVSQKEGTEAMMDSEIVRGILSDLVNRCANCGVDSPHRIIDPMDASRLRAALKMFDEIWQELLGDRAVCICGCPDADHDNYDEDGEGCGNIEHQCLRVASGVLEIANGLRAQVAAKEDSLSMTRLARIQTLATLASCEIALNESWEKLAAKDIKPGQIELAPEVTALARVRALEELFDNTEELLECANLRGDNQLPAPPDDPELWTARMQDAWDNTAEALEAARSGAPAGCGETFIDVFVWTRCSASKLCPKCAGNHPGGEEKK